MPHVPPDPPSHIIDIVAPCTLNVRFADATSHSIDFRPILAGESYGPLRDVELFNQVQIDPVAKTLVWPNRADFAPATFRDWPEYAAAFAEQARRWESVRV